jgi:hypothetical protein
MDENSSVLPLSDASMERGPGGEVYFRRSVQVSEAVQNQIMEVGNRDLRWKELYIVGGICGVLTNAAMIPRPTSQPCSKSMTTT